MTPSSTTFSDRPPEILTVFGGDPDAREREVRARLRDRRVTERPDDAETKPPPLPNGWFGAAFSSDLALGQVRTTRVCERELVLFRRADGTPAALDAYCPHLGAHLGVGGRVEGDDLVCPFHGWHWNGQGRCTRIDYASRIPKGAETRSYPVRDRNGFLYVWVHATGAEPSWEIEEIPEFSDAQYRAVARRRTVWSGHVQDVIENGVDLQHFSTVHRWKANAIDWQADGPAYRMTYDVASTRKDRGNFFFETKTEGCFTRTRFWGAYHGVTMHCLRQVEDGLIELLQIYLYRNDFPDKLALSAAAGSDFEWAADIPIWENKIHRRRPLLADEDGPVPAFRRWFSQFYSEG